MSIHRMLEGAVPAVLHLDNGVDVYSELRNFFINGGYKEVVIVGCAGSLVKVITNYPINDTLPPVVGHSTFEGVFEICTLNGNITWHEGKPRVHMHGSFAEKSEKVYGGAIGDGAITFKAADFFLLTYK